jgi:hypothetical protein
MVVGGQVTPMRTLDLLRRFRVAERWFSAHGGLVTRSTLADDHYFSLTMPNGAWSQFVLRDESEGEYEEAFVEAVEEMRTRRPRV